MRNAAGKMCRESPNKHCMFSKFFPRNSCRFLENVKKYGTAGQTTDDNIIRRMRTACWISETKNTHLECAILTAFPLQHWL